MYNKIDRIIVFWNTWHTAFLYQKYKSVSTKKEIEKISSLLYNNNMVNEQFFNELYWYKKNMISILSLF